MFDFSNIFGPNVDSTLLANHQQVLAGVTQWLAGASLGTTIDAVIGEPQFSAATTPLASDLTKDFGLLLLHAGLLSVGSSLAIQQLGARSNIFNGDLTNGLLFVTGLLQTSRNFNARVLKVGSNLKPLILEHSRQALAALPEALRTQQNAATRLRDAAGVMTSATSGGDTAMRAAARPPQPYWEDAPRLADNPTGARLYY